MVYKIRTGISWRDLPERHGPWQTVYTRFRRYALDGVFTRALQQIQAHADAAGDIDWLVQIGSTSVRAHQRPRPPARRLPPAEKGDQRARDRRDAITRNVLISASACRDSPTASSLATALNERRSALISQLRGACGTWCGPRRALWSASPEAVAARRRRAPTEGSGLRRGRAAGCAHRRPAWSWLKNLAARESVPVATAHGDKRLDRCVGQRR